VDEPTHAPSAPAAADGAQREDEGARVKASPLARRIAQERHIDLAALSGSGPGGRIVKSDVEGKQESSLMDKVATAKGSTTVVDLSRTQLAVARRMAESKATIPDFALRAIVDMEACVALRAQLKRLSEAQAPTYNDMVVKACALALREYPRANGTYKDGKLELHSRVNVGVAVAVQGADDGGASQGGALVVPTIFDADTKSLGEIALEARALAEKVRAGTITPPELGGGTFTVSNLGMYGVESFTAIVNPPQAGILAVGSVEQRAVVREEALVAGWTMAVTLGCDHRILYGADAAQFMARVRELLAEPAALTL
jgi:pyruvate dehydrogenase E2 component (dihydrolipoamide acetyltransferase)